MPPKLRNQKKKEDPGPQKKKVKQLLSGKADLCVVVKHPAPSNKKEEDDDDDCSKNDNKDNNNIDISEEEQLHAPLLEKEYQMHSEILASQSRFVDTALRVEMMEKETRTITFHCESPDLFEKALLYLTEPPAAKEATLDEVLKVLKFYHMYDFHGGLSFADLKIAECIEAKSTLIKRVGEKSVNFHTFDDLADILILANKLDLRESCEAGIDCLNDMFLCFPYFWGRPFFTKEIVTKLQPFLHQHHRCIMFPKGANVSREEVVDGLFPKYFCKCTEVKSITLEGTGNEDMDCVCYPSELIDCWRTPVVNIGVVIHDGTSTLERGCSRAIIKGCPYEVYLRKDRESGFDWGVYAKNIEDRNSGVEWSSSPNFALWRSPNSSHLPYPPMTPWDYVDAHDLVDKRAKPKVLPFVRLHSQESTS